MNHSCRHILTILTNHNVCHWLIVLLACSFVLLIHSFTPHIQFIAQTDKNRTNTMEHILVNQIIIQDYLRHFFPSFSPFIPYKSVYLLHLWFCRHVSSELYQIYRFGVFGVFGGNISLCSWVQWAVSNMWQQQQHHKMRYIIYLRKSVRCALYSELIANSRNGNRFVFEQTQ